MHSEGKFKWHIFNSIEQETFKHVYNIFSLFEHERLNDYFELSKVIDIHFLADVLDFLGVLWRMQTRKKEEGKALCCVINYGLHIILLFLKVLILVGLVHMQLCSIE